MGIASPIKCHHKDSTLDDAPQEKKASDLTVDTPYGEGKLKGVSESDNGMMRVDLKFGTAYIHPKELTIKEEKKDWETERKLIEDKHKAEYAKLQAELDAANKNLEKLRAFSAAKAVDKLVAKAPAAEEKKIALNDTVVIHGLETKKELNGLRGTVVELMKEGRYTVAVGDDNFALKPGNITKITDENAGDFKGEKVGIEMYKEEAKKDLVFQHLASGNEGAAPLALACRWSALPYDMSEEVPGLSVWKIQVHNIATRKFKMGQQFAKAASTSRLPSSLFAGGKPSDGKAGPDGEAVAESPSVSVSKLTTFGWEAGAKMVVVTVVDEYGHVLGASAKTADSVHEPLFILGGSLDEARYLFIQFKQLKAKKGCTKCSEIGFSYLNLSAESFKQGNQNLMMYKKPSDFTRDPAKLTKIIGSIECEISEVKSG